MHHTHAPSENENFPSAKPPAWTSFLSFFPSHFRSSFRHFCHVLCDFYFSFQVPKPPVFAAFSLLQGILLLILFFLFLRQKTSSQGNPLKQGFWWFYGIFNFFFLSFFLSYLCSVSIFSRFTVTFREPEIIKRNRIKSGKRTCIWTFAFTQTRQVQRCC